MKRCSRHLSINVLVVALGLLLAISSIGFASDYQPLPGILGPEDVDFGGQTVTIVRGGLPDEERVAEAERLFNVKINSFKYDSVEHLISRIMAGDSTLDIIRMPHRQGYYQLVSSGMLMPVGDMLPEEHYEALSVTDRYTIEKLQYQGQYYGFGSHHGLHNGSMMFMFYNKDILERENQPDPYELWKENKWTYDAFEEIARAVTKDTTGDGVVDQFGMPSLLGSNQVYRFAPSNGVELVREEDGKYIFNYDSPEAIRVLNRINRWREDGLMGGDFNSGTLAFTDSHLAGIRNAKAVGINYGMVPMPMGPDVDRYHYPVFEFWMMMLPVNAEYPEGLMALGAFLYREEDTYDDLDFRINEYMTSREQAEVYVSAIENWRGEGDPFQNTELWTITSSISDAVNGVKGAAAVVDEITPEAQAYLDDLFGQ